MFVDHDKELAYHRARRQAKPEEYEVTRLKYRFKVSKDDATYLMHRATEGVCDACGGRDEFRRLNVDHNHQTGKIRGVLCHPCNVILGLIKEDSSRLRKLSEYLNASKE